MPIFALSRTGVFYSAVKRNFIAGNHVKAKLAHCSFRGTFLLRTQINPNTSFTRSTPWLQDRFIVAKFTFHENSCVFWIFSISVRKLTVVLD
ncbi:hypothetical protein BpHYR1_036219 [Brachionus plicatilis]|uniref:Uncharacterized protein n=1 Tax=Brachionus plicatilis TaxID=10195 RepID=A0A3M7S4D4_BRAPC|nr:hypothetical protein BpHYR1_036219 [Brachionus plicatilis]